jgi:uncharacterized membrane protein YeaQ/YmgE (transglycosylase-associated protein family)
MSSKGGLDMNSLVDPVVSFIVVLLIGIVAGLLAHRFWRTSWLSQQIAGRNRGAVTSALVGIAGAFIGFNLGVLLKLSASGSIALFIAAALGAALILWGWKTLKI